MKQTRIETIYNAAATLAAGTYYTRTIPSRGASFVGLAVFCGEAQTGTLVSVPGATENSHGDQTTADDAYETVASWMGATVGDFATAGTPGTSVWQYNGVRPATACPCLPPKFIRFKLTVAAATLTKLTIKIFAIYDNPGMEQDGTNGASL